MGLIKCGFFSSLGKLEKKGKAAFREAFSRISELRSLLKSCTPVLGLTGTANREMHDGLMHEVPWHEEWTIANSCKSQQGQHSFHCGESKQQVTLF